MIYFIQDPVTKAIKIGVSSKPHSRLADLQVAHSATLVLLGVMDGGNYEEAMLHSRFTRLRGEWFAPTPDLVAFIVAEATPVTSAKLRLYADPSSPPPTAVVPDLSLTDLASMPYDNDTLWMTVLLALVERNSRERLPDWKIARLVASTLPRKQQLQAEADILRIVMTARSLPSEQSGALLCDVPDSVLADLNKPSVQAQSLRDRFLHWRNLLPGAAAVSPA